MKRSPRFAANRPAGMPIFLYLCGDDEVVPFAHMERWMRGLQQATVRVCHAGGHQVSTDLSVVARDIAALHR